MPSVVVAPNVLCKAPLITVCSSQLLPVPFKHARDVADAGSQTTTGTDTASLEHALDLTAHWVDSSFPSLIFLEFKAWKW